MNERYRNQGITDHLKSFLENNSKGLLIALAVAASAAAWNGSKYVEFNHESINYFSWNYKYKMQAKMMDNMARLTSGALVETQENWPWYLGLIALGPVAQAATRKIANIRTKLF